MSREADEGPSITSVCVFASSSERIDAAHRIIALSLGAAVAARGWTLVYGGAKVGLMGAVAAEAKRRGGRVVGIIPRHIAERGLAFTQADEVIVTETLRERKAEMESRSDAFIALPGGFGTLEELLEIITLKQLHLHARPVCLLSVNRFYEPLVALFEHLYREGFAREEYRSLYEVCDGVEAAMSYLEEYRPVELGEKWR